jgi:hypothetical protein
MCQALQSCIGHAKGPTEVGPFHSGVNDGTRTRDIRHHKPALYQLSYAHHVCQWQRRRVYYNLGSHFDTTDAEIACTSSVVGPGSATKPARR